jgi:hypothetical protein
MAPLSHGKNAPDILEIRSQLIFSALRCGTQFAFYNVKEIF